MITAVRNWLSTNWVILSNASSMIGTTVTTSALGFAYWWVAARLFPMSAVGLASATISAMMLLGFVGVFGMGTWLVGELPRRPHEAGPLITTALLVVGGVSGLPAVLFIFAAPAISSEFEPLAQDWENIILFVTGVAFTSITVVLDLALVGLLRGMIQLWRNIIFAILKLVALFFVTDWFTDKLWLAIYTTWVFGLLISLVPLVGFAVVKGIRIIHRPRLKLLQGLGKTILGHHAINLALQAPGFALPVLVTAIISAEANASFYAAWMIANLVFILPSALTMVLFAVGRVDPSILAQKVRLTLKLSVITGLLNCIVMLIAADFLLGLFGNNYAEQSGLSLRVLSFGVFPIIVKAHYVAICRVYDRVMEAVKLTMAGAILELIMAATGGFIGSQVELSLGWVLGLCFEAVLTGSLVYKIVTLPEESKAEPVDKFKLPPATSPNYADQL